MRCDDSQDRFGCSGGGCASGRPFLVNGAPRTALCEARDDWRERELVPRAWKLHPELCGELAEAWARAGLAEHASVAAFARFTLELMSLGAPAELIERATSAISDETKHAKMCFALASSYAGRVVGPGALPVEGSLNALSFSEIVLNAVREGCIGETVAAIEASEALEHASDSVVRKVLREISLDETRHSELAWRFVKWALRSADESLLGIVRDEFERAAAEASAPTHDLSKADKELLSAGVIPERLRPAIRARALENVVLPCARALLSEAARSRASAPEHGRGLEELGPGAPSR